MIQIYNEMTNKDISFNRLENMKKSHSKLKQAFIVFEIMKVHDITSFAQAVRFYNFCIVKKFSSKDILKKINTQNYSSISISELNGISPISILRKGNTYQDVHALTKLLLVYLS